MALKQALHWLGEWRTFLLHLQTCNGFSVSYFLPNTPPTPSIIPHLPTMYSMPEYVCECVCVGNTSQWRAVFELPAAAQRQLSGLTWPLSAYLSFNIPHFCLFSSQAEVMPAVSACSKANSVPAMWVNNATSDFSASKRGAAGNKDLCVHWIALTYDYRVCTVCCDLQQPQLLRDNDKKRVFSSYSTHIFTKQTLNILTNKFLSATCVTYTHVCRCAKSFV